MGLQEADLSDTDEGVLRLLEDGRCSPGFLASELDRQQPYISQRLKRLVEHGHVRRVDRGLYELEASPLSEAEMFSTYRDRALSHYGEECDVCGETENIVVHHRDGDRSNNDLPNLLPLCESCHGKVHGRSDEVPELVRDLGYRPTSPESTTISVPEDVADELYARKGRGESYADVIWRLLEGASEGAESVEESPDREVVSKGVEVDDVQEEGVDDVEGLDDDLAALVDEVGSDVLPGSGTKLGARRAALVAVVEYLCEHGSGTPEEFRTEVYPDHSAYYTEGEDPARSWWKNCIYKGLSALAERSEEIEAADSSGVWRYAPSE